LVFCEPGQCDIAVHGHTVKGLELIIHKAPGGGRPYRFIQGDADRNAESFWEDLEALGQKFLLKALGTFATVCQEELRGGTAAARLNVTSFCILRWITRRRIA